jgi:hypothetical protein
MERARTTRRPNRSLESDLNSILETPSQPLDAATLETMEARFSHQFADVQVHSSADTNALDARAVAFGNHVAFHPGQYAPGTPHGDHLIAHELAHVVQSRNSSRRANLELAAPDASSEHEAHRAADRVASGSNASSLTSSTAGVVSRSVWDWIPGMGGFSDSQPVVLPEAPGNGVQSGPYVYGNTAPAGGGGGINFGYGRGHAQGETQTTGLFTPGDTAKASGTYDTERIEGHIGGWNVPRQDGGNDVNVGFQLNGKSPSASGELSYTGPDGRGAYLQGDVNGPAFDVSSYVGTGGFNFGAQAAVGGFNIGGGTRGTDTDEYNKIGLSEGVGAAVRGNWGDTDGDGFREYGGGFDVGPVSVDMRSEDPLRAAVRMGGGILPGMGYIAEQFIDEGNFTERTANRMGLTTRHADLGTTWDVVKDAASYVGGGIYDAGAAVGGGLYDAGAAVGGGIYDAGAAVGQGLYDAGGAIYDAGAVVGEGLYDAGAAVGGGIYDAGAAVGSGIYDAGAAIGSGAADLAGEAWDAIPDWPW